jgi:hypothetical protein
MEIKKVLVEKGDFIGEMCFSFGEIFYMDMAGFDRYTNRGLVY